MFLNKPWALIALIILGLTFLFPKSAPAPIGGPAVVADPCQQAVKQYVSIDQTTNTQYVTGTAGERIYICSFKLSTNGAEDIALVSGTGSVCADSTSGVAGMGGSTAGTGMQLNAGGGETYGNGGFAIAKTDTDGDNVCVFQSASGQVSGGFSYVSS